MRADVAVGDGAEHGVGDRVQQHVGVGMADQRRDRAATLTPPSQTWSPSPKAWTSNPWPVRTSGRSLSILASRPAQKILLRGQFDVVGFARKDEDAMAGPFRDGGVVGQFAASVVADGAMGGEDQAEAEGLRRLHGAQRGAVRRRDDALVLRRSA